MNHIVCRCEDVTIEDVKDALASGVCTAQEIKFHTRAGMGFCQGRVCRTAIEELLEQSGVAAETGGSSMTVRLPVRPVSLGDFAEIEVGEGGHAA
ncbi:MAG: (2Fe-2S)-binding protein [Leucobacter sp.]